jgi:hypothetical protein
MFNKKPHHELYTIFNLGTPHAFNPHKKVIDQFTNKERTLLSIHLEKVRESRSKTVYILDNHGKEVY